MLEAQLAAMLVSACGWQRDRPTNCGAVHAGLTCAEFEDHVRSEIARGTTGLDAMLDNHRPRRF